MGEAKRRAAKPKVMVGFCHPPDYPAVFGNNLVMWSLWDSTHNQRWTGQGGGQFCAMESSPRIAAARNRIVRAFLASDCELLWMRDADMYCPNETLERLESHLVPGEIDMAAALYFIGGRGATHTPAIYDFVTLEDGRRSAIEVQDYTPGEVRPTGGTGAGCVLIHRRVFEIMGEKLAGTVYPWFADTELDGQEIGEDITFFMRAAALGFKLVIDTGLVALHEKRRMLSQQTFDDQQAFIAEHGIDALWKRLADERGATLA